MTLDYRNPLSPIPPKRGRHLLWQIPLMCLIAASFAACLIDVFHVNLDTGSRETRDRVHSQMNLRQIGQGILMYTQDYAGSYPDTLPTLLMAEDIGPGIFVSPSTNDTPAIGPTTRAIADSLLTGGHCSYVYLGRGWNARAVTAKTVVAYEPPANQRTGGNVLFGNGDVKFCSAQWWSKYFAALSARPASTQPITLPPG